MCRDWWAVRDFPPDSRIDQVLESALIPNDFPKRKESICPGSILRFSAVTICKISAHRVARESELVEYKQGDTLLKASFSREDESGEATRSSVRGEL